MTRRVVLPSLIFLLTSVIVLSINVWKVEACEVIYIRADGSVDPADVPISTVDNVTYTLTGNIASDAHGIVVERDNIIIDGSGYMVQGTASENSTGINLTDTINVTIKNTHVKEFYYGIYLNYADEIIISGNNITNNEYGVALWYSSVTISGNNITNNNLCGITFHSSLLNSISGNNITNNDRDGVYVNSSSYNNISGNNITNNERGIIVEHSNDITISENTLAVNNLGILLEYSSWNRFYHNTLVNNVEQARVYESSNSYWDDSHPSGGNYWSDYTGIDENAGPNQDQPGSDCIGDTQYNIDTNNKDNYPLMNPWTGTVYIRTNGNVEPSIAPIQRADDIYAFAGDIFGSIIVEQDNIVVDGAGHTVQGTGAYESGGIDLSYRSNVTIKNTQIKKFYYGILLNSSSSNNISENNITNNDEDGVYVNSSSYNNISGNNITNNERGMDLNWDSNHNSIVRNNVTNNGRGRYGVGINLVNSSDNIISGNNIINNNNADIGLDSSSNNTIAGNNIADSEYGISAFYSSNHNSISGNEITENSKDGIELYLSAYNSISGNNIAENSRYGIHVYSSSYNIVSGNDIVNNEYGIEFSWSPDHAAENNKFYHNNFMNNTKHAIPSIFANTWDDGYPSGGNYWDDYNGTDGNHDGIGDTPYVLFVNNTDRYPLVNTYIVPEFPSSLGMLLFAMATLPIVLIYRQKQKRTR